MELMAPKSISVLYTEYGNEIRHYSSVRTSLTTFLMTVSLTAFSTSSASNHTPYLVAAGFIFSFAAIWAGLYFSFRSVRAIIRYKRLRGLLGTVRDDSPDVKFDLELTAKEIRAKMWRDPMNWLLVVGDIALTLCFVFVHKLGWLLSTLHIT